MSEKERKNKTTDIWPLTPSIERLNIEILRIIKETGQEGKIREPDIEVLVDLLAAIARENSLGELADKTTPMIESDLLKFKHAVKPFEYSSLQYKLVQDLNSIERRAEEYPLLSPQNVGELCRLPNPSYDVFKLIREQKLLSFTFGESNTFLLPEFQFNLASNETWEPVPYLCVLFAEVSDWIAFEWFTTYTADLGMTPAAALQNTHLHEELADLAGLYVGECRCAHLSFLG
ncbi:hypothetical protein JCM19231_2996 [Vibrio ishigakensis]|uniref:Uncharacterized protein n=1 Tax=Vibrio ishigakensis TaxID=1481914 RepID=A0A0B8NY46_9VIBR|nr:hypothetical protein [Vibrio ishigakensis]GAM55644.1 hypothetical protein JCM19231_2996 [Vibrio ishigakensis]